MSARSFCRLLARLAVSLAAQTFPCSTSSIRATRSGVPRISRSTAPSTNAWHRPRIQLNLHAEIRSGERHVQAVRKALEAKAIGQQRLEARQILDGDDDVEAEADDGLRVGVHGLTANNAVPDAFPLEQRDELSEQVRAIHGDRLPECLGSHDVNRGKGSGADRPWSTRGSHDQIETGGIGEAAEVPVPGCQGNAVIHAALRDEGIPESRLSPLRQHLRAQHARALPVALAGLDQGNL